MTNGLENDTAAVIVAAGRGRRAGGEIAKQWQEVAGARVIDHTLHAFRSHPAISQIVLVLAADDLSETFDGVLTTGGGANRAQSVKAGLEVLAAPPHGRVPSQVLIHDVARPCISASAIDAVIATLDTAPGAALALPVTDALWRGTDGFVTGTPDRSGLFRAQTPQGFHFDKILAAHRANDADAADDVAVARAAGIDVAMVPGSEENLKITHPPDFDRAARILETLHGHQARQRI